MRQDVHDLLTFINSFLIREFNEYQFNSLSTKDFITFEILDQIITPSDAAEKEGIYPTIRYVTHYFTKLKERLEDPLFHLPEKEITANFNDATALLKKWVKEAIENKIVSLSKKVHASAKNDVLNLTLSASELGYLRFICDSLISLLDKQLFIENTDMLKLRTLYNAKYLIHLNNQLDELEAGLYTCSIQITEHYHHSLNLAKDPQEKTVWDKLGTSIQKAIATSSAIHEDSSLKLSQLRALSSYFQKEELTLNLNAYSDLLKKADKLRQKYLELKQSYDAAIQSFFPKPPISVPFRETQNEIKRSVNIWKILLIYSAVGIVLVDLYIFIYIPWQFGDIIDTTWFPILIPVSLVTPFIWLAWLATKSYIFETRLKYQYLDKATIASAYNTYANTAATEDAELRKTTFKHLFKPLKINWGKEPASPLEDLLKNRSMRKFLTSLLKDDALSLKGSLKTMLSSKSNHKDTNEETELKDTISKDLLSKETTDVKSAPASKDHKAS